MRNTYKQIDDNLLTRYILPQVEKPAQYAGGEYNSVVKDWDQSPATMVFAFPDSYEIGMSHLGLRLLYETVNNHSPFLMERVFMPLPDLAQLLREGQLPLFSLESRRPLADFDLIGFTLQYELSYTNILAMLDLAGLPLRAAQREEGQPLVIAGGPCAFNPEPLAEIIDLFVLGEGEEVILELLELVARGKKAGWSRRELLRQATAVAGVYVPCFYQASYDQQGRYLGLSLTADAPPATPLTVSKRILTDLDAAPFPERPLLPNIQPVHDRVMLELMRGCTHGCRFCQAGMIYRPRREKSPETLRRQAALQCAHSGYEDIALLSLSSADYSHVERLMDELLADHREQGVGVSLPSLRVDAFSVSLAARTQAVRKSGITLAPEAGSSRLRDTINKGVGEEDILTAATAAFSQGYSHIKLYFMLGLPFEDDGDILAIAALCKKILELGRRHKPAEVKKPLRLSLGVASFVPKSHTPFQWQGQNSVAELQRKQELLREAIRPLRAVTLNCHDRRTSLLEAALARGDRRLNQVLLTAYSLGCVMDGWSEHFRPDRWQQAFAAHGLSQEEIAQRQILFGEALPWSHLDCGVSQDWLWRENIRAGRAELTPDCSSGSDCGACGVCEVKDDQGRRWQPQLLPAPASRTLPRPTPAPPATSAGQPLLYKYRCQLAISDPACWCSHLDLLAMLEKTLRRSNLPLAFSQGFNPHLLISWGPAHPVGLRGEHEYADLVFTRPPAEDWVAVFNRCAPPGLRLVQARPIEMNAPALMAAINRARLRLRLEGPGAGPEELDAAIAALLAQERLEVERNGPKGRKRADIRPSLVKLWREGEDIRAELRLDQGATARAPELATLLAPGATLAAAERDGLFIAGEQGLELP